jgi:hypothetical protein
MARVNFYGGGRREEPKKNRFNQQTPNSQNQSLQREMQTRNGTRKGTGDVRMQEQVNKPPTAAVRAQEPPTSKPSQQYKGDGGYLQAPKPTSTQTTTSGSPQTGATTQNKLQTAYQEKIDPSKVRTATTTSTGSSYWDQFGGQNSYVQSQQARYQQAIASGDTDLANRLQADAARVGYTLPNSQPTSSGTVTDTGYPASGGGVNFGQIGSTGYYQDPAGFNGNEFPQLDMGVVQETGYADPALTQSNVTGGAVGPQQQEGISAQTDPAYQSNNGQSEGTPQQQREQAQTEVRGTFDELQRIVQGAVGSPELAPMVAQAYEQVMRTIQQAEGAITARFQEQMGGVDPATQSALASIKEAVEEQRSGLNEEMSRRGLLQSGVWLEMSDRINKGQLTAQQRLLGERVADLQNRLMSSLMNFAGMKVNASQQYSLEGLRAVEGDVNRKQQLAERNLERSLQNAWQNKQYALQELQTRLPYTTLTESERQRIPMEWTQMMGEVPNSQQGNVYDPATSVNNNSSSFDPSASFQFGGKNLNAGNELDYLIQQSGRSEGGKRWALQQAQEYGPQFYDELRKRIGQ